MFGYSLGAVVIVQFDSPAGGSTSRHCLIVQNDVGNKYSARTIVVPLSARKSIKRLDRLYVEVPAAQAGVDFDCVADCTRIVTIDQVRIASLCGRISSDTMDAVDQALRISLGIHH